MMSDGNDGKLVVCDDIDWTSIDCTDEGEITEGDEKCDIQEFLGSIEFIDSICLDLEYHEDFSSWNDRLLVTSVGQPTCETKDKMILEATSTEKVADSSENGFVLDVWPCKKSKHVAIGPSHRRSKKKIKGLPKRPLSAYNLFFKKERLKIFEEGLMNQERISFQGLAKLVGQRWQMLDEETRQELRRRSQEDVIRYQHEMKEYRGKHCNDSTIVLARKRCPLDSPMSLKSVLKLPLSLQQKRRISEGTSIAPLENLATEDDQVVTVSDATMVMKQSHIMGESLVESKIKNKVCFSKTEEMERRERRTVASTLNQHLLMSLSESLLHEQDPPIATSQAQSDTVFQASHVCVTAPAPIYCPTQIRAPKGTHYQSKLFYHNPAQIQIPRTLQHPIRRSYVSTLPVGKEVHLYDPRTGIRIPYRIEYKCFAMTRSEADAYVARNSYQGINGSHYLPLENMLRAVPPPGVEVPVPLKKSVCQ
jgi:HMG (high mobility group) box